eukprot:2665397-Pyramimonas_sp.AAC.1
MLSNCMIVCAIVMRWLGSRQYTCSTSEVDFFVVYQDPRYASSLHRQRHAFSRSCKSWSVHRINARGFAKDSSELCRSDTWRGANAISKEAEAETELANDRALVDRVDVCQAWIGVDPDCNGAIAVLWEEEESSGREDFSSREAAQSTADQLHEVAGIRLAQVQTEIAEVGEEVGWDLDLKRRCMPARFVASSNLTQGSQPSHVCYMGVSTSVTTITASIDCVFSNRVAHVPNPQSTNPLAWCNIGLDNPKTLKPITCLAGSGHAHEEGAGGQDDAHAARLGANVGGADPAHPARIWLHRLRRVPTASAL